MNVDKKALKILRKYDVLEPEKTSKEDFEYALQHGLMFYNVEMEHDKTIEKIKKEITKVKKRKTTNLFLSSLSTHRLEWRIGLSVYAVLSVFPEHTYQDRNRYCKICSASSKDEVDLSFANVIRYFVGSIISGDIYENYFILEQHQKLEDIEPNEKDMDIFLNILSMIKNVESKDKKKDILKRMRMIEGFQSKEEERRGLLETLGYCSILETKEKRGFLNGFTNIDTAKQSRHSTDWSYPVDWWQPRDGINYEALNDWFGGYLEIKEWIQQNR